MEFIEEVLAWIGLFSVIVALCLVAIAVFQELKHG